jgi:hypothetical protein
MFIWASGFHSIEEVRSLNKQGLKDDWSSGTCDSFFFSKEKKERVGEYVVTAISIPTPLFCSTFVTKLHHDRSVVMCVLFLFMVNN